MKNFRLRINGINQYRATNFQGYSQHKTVDCAKSKKFTKC